MPLREVYLHFQMFLRSASLRSLAQVLLDLGTQFFRTTSIRISRRANVATRPS